jgi:hypothetical protein
MIVCRQSQEFDPMNRPDNWVDRHFGTQVNDLTNPELVRNPFDCIVWNAGAHGQIGR